MRAMGAENRRFAGVVTRIKAIPGGDERINLNCAFAAIKGGGSGVCFCCPVSMAGLDPATQKKRESVRHQKPGGYRIRRKCSGGFLLPGTPRTALG